MHTKAKKPLLLTKVPTGVSGFDEITGGGLPEHRATLLAGGPGAGKTVFALQTLVDGAVQSGEPGIFVAFEENARQIVTNAATFGWDLVELEKQKLFFLDAHIKPEEVKPDSFNLKGLLAGVEVVVKQLGAKRIVFDSLDVLLTLLDNPAAERQELYRLHDWLRATGLTAIITAKVDEDNPSVHARYAFMKFMVDAVVMLSNPIENHNPVRRLRVVKYRGSDFFEKECPFLIGPGGIEVASLRIAKAAPQASLERISSGVEPLDQMLGGGYFRGSSVLITGASGTAKSILCGAFAAAACRRKERILYVSLEESASELQRNLSSVGIRLTTHVQSGMLHLWSPPAEASSAEVYWIKLKQLMREFQPRGLVIDPLSVLGKTSGGVAQEVCERLIKLAKSEGVTVMCTSLLPGSGVDVDSGTALRISSLADTWIHLAFVVQSGERNRALSIMKARGMCHSNQVCEMILSEEGVFLADAYTVNGEILMGSMRWQREHAEQVEQQQIHGEVELKRREIELAREELKARVAALHRELNMKEAELDYLLKAEGLRQGKTGAKALEPAQPSPALEIPDGPATTIPAPARPKTRLHRRRSF